MVKPSLFKQRHFEKNLHRNWFATRFLKQNNQSEPASNQPAQPAYAAEMRVEGINESARSSEEVERSPQPGRPQSPKLPKLPKPDWSAWAQKPWRWSLIWLAALGVLGGMGTAALIWLVSLPPQIDCRNPSRLSLDMERLYCAQEAAQSGDIAKLIAGIDLLRQWQPEHPLYREAQRLIEEWSGQVFTIAARRVERGDLKGAEAALSHVPNTTPVYADIQKSLARWRKYSKEASNLYARAQTSLKQKDWDAVSQQIVLLAEFERDRWELQKGADALAEQLGVEKQAWKVLSRAQRMANSGSLEQLGAAIPVALEVPVKTYAATTAKANLKQWSQKLVAVGSQKWQKGDRAGAIATLKLAPSVTNTPEIEELYRFSNAYQLADSAISQHWIPSVGGILNLTEAIAALEKVKSSSPFYAQAQALKKSWQAQLQDLIQLKYASIAASLGPQSTLKLAIGQAKQIEAGQPRRVQAQSMIAFWESEVERLQDQPIVDRAVRLAKAGTIDALKAAIVQASEVDLGRSLRRQAQTLIATWRSQIQTIEDRPKLDQAWELARSGKLGEAIQTASNIQPGRSLYSEAQRAISEWRYQQMVAAQIAQDQPLLDRANALAENGNLSAAIDVASQIGSGRVLYSRAQSAIGRWEAQLNPPLPEPREFSQPSFDPYTPPNQLFPNDAPAESSPSPYPSDTGAFPSPLPSGTPVPLQLAPPPSPQTTYEPFAEPTVIPEPEAPANERSDENPQPAYEPAPAEPQPPQLVDPLPPSP